MPKRKNLQFMKKPDRYDEDILGQYIYPENIEKAPEGFTQKVMTRISYDTEPARTKESLLSRIRVQVISAVIVLILTITVLIIPDSGKALLPELKLFQDIKLPEIKFSLDSYFNFPSLAAYLFAGIILLVIFDKALYGLFHRKE
jgi:hypothetical protein